MNDDYSNKMLPWNCNFFIKAFLFKKGVQGRPVSKEEKNFLLQKGLITEDQFKDGINLFIPLNSYALYIVMCLRCLPCQDLRYLV